MGKMPNNVESRIRDNLINSLDFIEEGLIFLEKEKYLPHSLGTRGFVDIYAQDVQGNHVLIELKRSNSACREALHEVLKYIEAVKENLGANDDEIRVIIVSTEWDELIVPYSAFVKQVLLYVQGYQLEVDDDCKPIRANLIEPLKLNTSRLFSPHHSMHFYTSQANLQKGIQSHIASMKTKGLKDYVLLIFEAGPDFHRLEIEQTYQLGVEMAQSMGLEKPLHTLEELQSKMPEYRYMIYLAAQQLNVERYLELLANNQETLQEVLEVIKDYETDEEKLSTCENNLLYSLPEIYREYTAVSYPAKLINLLEDPNWKLLEIRRIGVIARNTLLSDETILSELEGDSGITHQRYRKQFDSANLVRFAAIKQGVRLCLKDNPVWLSDVLQIIDGLEKEARVRKFNGEIVIYNPNSILHTIYQFLTVEGGLRYIPTCRVTIDYSAEESTTFIGTIEATGAQPNLQDLLKQFYKGEIPEMVKSLIWGGYEANDRDIMENIGLQYCMYKVVKRGNTIKFLTFPELSRVPRFAEQFGAFVSFIDANKEFAESVAEAFSSRHIGGSFVDLKDD